MKEEVIPVVYLGADHAGFELKETTKVTLANQGYICEDLGAYKLNKDDDYPYFAQAVSAAVHKDPKSRGILFCGSGQGMCIAANKVKGIRAIAVSSVKEARKAREHLNANILCLSGWNITRKQAEKVVDTFLTTPFSHSPRHERRIRKLE